MNDRTRALLLGGLALAASEASAQRLIPLGPYNGGPPPVTAHRQVVWVNGLNLSLSNGGGGVPTNLPTGLPPGAVIQNVGFTGPGQPFYFVYNTASANGYYAWSGGPVRPPVPGTGFFYADGNAAVYVRSDRDVGLYTAAGGHTALTTDGSTTWDDYPHVDGNFVVWQKRPSALPNWQVHQFNRATPATPPWVNDSVLPSQYARTDEAGRVAWTVTSANPQVRLWNGAAPSRIVTSGAETVQQFTYGVHHGQFAFLRQSGGSFDLLYEGSGPQRIVANLFSPGGWGLSLRNGMISWINGSSLQLFDGQQTVTLATALGPTTGSHLDKGWAVFVSAGQVWLRESALVWQQDTVRSATGGSVRFDLHAGPANAGRTHLLLASVSGTHPGLLLPTGGTLPLNPDAVFLASHQLANSSILVNTLARLDASGNGVALFVAPPGLPVGLYLSFAYALIDGSTPLDYASNPARVKVVP